MEIVINWVKINSQGYIVMGKVYDGLHRISYLINEEGVIEHVFNKFKTKDHHEVVVNYLKENA